MKDGRHRRSRICLALVFALSTISLWVPAEALPCLPVACWGPSQPTPGLDIDFTKPKATSDATTTTAIVRAGCNPATYSCGGVAIAVRLDGQGAWQHVAYTPGTGATTVKLVLPAGATIRDVSAVQYVCGKLPGVTRGHCGPLYANETVPLPLEDI